jgi:hypothetical protein
VDGERLSGYQRGRKRNTSVMSGGPEEISDATAEQWDRERPIGGWSREPRGSKGKSRHSGYFSVMELAARSRVGLTDSLVRTE